MALSISEVVNSGDWSNDSVTLRWQVEGSAAIEAVYDFFIAQIPEIFAGRALTSNITLRPDRATIDTVNNTGLWNASAQYGARQIPTFTPEESEIGTVRILVDTTGGTAHITHSFSTRSQFGTGSEDLDQAIGMAADRLSIEGVDITVPVFNMTVTKVWDKNSIPSYNTIFGLTGEVNSSIFSVSDTETGKSLTFLTGECLFVGAQIGSLRSDDGIEIAYSFSAIPNRSGISFAGISGITKLGWDYMWALTYPGQDGNNRDLPKTERVYVERVYEAGNLNNLNI